MSYYFTNLWNLRKVIFSDISDFIALISKISEFANIFITEVIESLSRIFTGSYLGTFQISITEVSEKFSLKFLTFISETSDLHLNFQIFYGRSLWVIIPEMYELLVFKGCTKLEKNVYLCWKSIYIAIMVFNTKMGLWHNNCYIFT